MGRCRAWRGAGFAKGWDDCFWLHKYSDEEAASDGSKTGGFECWLSMERFDKPEGRECSCPLWEIRDARDRLKRLRKEREVSAQGAHVATDEKTEEPTNGGADN